MALNLYDRFELKEILEISGKVEAKALTQVFSRHAEATLFLTFSNGERIETTKEHPFFVESRGFAKAGELGIGTSIVTRAGPSLRVTSTEVGKAQTVYNFEVEDFHTYFVGKSQTVSFGNRPAPLVN